MNDEIDPLFVFCRRIDIEREYGFRLAGQLVLDLPKDAIPPSDWEDIIKMLVKKFAGTDNEIVSGWRNGAKPPNAVDLSTGAQIDDWAQDRLVICIRVCGRDQGDNIIFDNDLLAQAMGPAQGTA